MSGLNMKQFTRISYIHQQIALHRFPNRRSLAEHLKVSEMTIYRDMNIMRCHEPEGFDAPIDFSVQENGFYYREDNFELPLLKTIGENELQILSSAKILLSYFKNSPLFEEIEAQLDSICSCAKQKKDGLPFLNRIALAPNPYTTQKIQDGVWNVVNTALKENYVIRFRYKKDNWDPEVEVKNVRPYQLLLDRGRSFLFGFLEEKKDVRLYDLNKMSGTVITGRKFNLPAKFEFENYCGGGHFGAFTRYHPKKYKIAFYEDAREEVTRGNWADDQVIEQDDENDCTTITFTASQDMPILDWVFQNKAYAVPLEPPSLVQRWKYNVGVMAQEAGYRIKVDVDINEVNRMELKE